MIAPRSAPGPDGRPTNPFEPFPRSALDASIPDRFASILRREADRLAVKMGTAVLSYGALDRASNRVANAILDRLGVAPEPVALLLPQGVPQVAAVLGTLKAGKIYVPLDPAHQPARTSEAIADTGTRLIVTTTAHARRAAQVSGTAALLCVDSIDGRDTAPGLAVDPDAGAYVFYTSGSTGRPKGVLDTHRNVLHNVMRYTNTLHLGPGDRLTLLQGPSFSGAVSSLFGALLNGAAVFPFDVAREGADRIAGWLAAESITVYHSVPALFRHVAPHGAALPALRLVRLEGDHAALGDLDLFRRHFASDCVLVNGLGATECGLVRQFFFTPADPMPPHVVPIGSPVEDMEIVLLGEADRPVPPGETGEIAVRSRYLAVGYWQRPELTAARFRPDPSSPGSRLYLTGDLGRLQPGDVLEHLGRHDGAAKVRGQRVEIADVEAALARLPGIAAAAAAVRGDDGGEPRLVAYLVARDGAPPTVSALRRMLAERLPEALMPSAFVTLAQLPLDDNGKLDRRALPAPGSARPALDPAFAPPQGTLERTITDAWSAVLGIAPIGRHDDFFDLGGDSLKAATGLARIAPAAGVDLALEDLFDAPTVAALARRIQARPRATPAGAPRRAPRAPGTPLPLSLPQRRLWFLHRLAPDTAAYHVPLATRLRGPLDVEALRRALSSLTERHEALRATFGVADGEPFQRFPAPAPFTLPVEDLGSAAIQRRIADEAAAPFDLEQGPPLRARLIRLDAADHVLVLTFHHLAVDGGSLHVLTRELEALYDAHRGHSAAPLPPIQVPYGDFVLSQREHLDAAAMDAQLAYWRERLADAPIALALPTDRRRPDTASLAGAQVPIAVPEALVTSLRSVARQESATLYMTLLAAFQVLLARHAEQDEVLIGSPVAGRSRAELESVVGFFANTLTLRGDLRGDPTFRELLGRTRRTVLDALANQDVPLERLVEALGPAREPGRNPLFQAMLSLENAPAAALALPGLRAISLPVALAAAKVDVALMLAEEAGELRGALEYCTDLFEPPTARRWCAQLLALLAEIARDPDRPVSRLPLQTDAQRARIVATGEALRADFDAARSLPALFSEQALRTPDAIAVLDGDRAVTYRELHRHARVLAGHLWRQGVRPGERVGLRLGRSIEEIAAMLGVVGLGAAYVPLDPSFPPSRIDAILEDAGARLAVTAATVTGLAGQEEIEGEWPSPGGEDLAYVMYTSGSMGAPKGVAIPHRAVVRLVRDTDYVRLGPDDVVAHLSNPAFDAATFEIWGALLNGARVVVIDPETALAPGALGAAIARHGVTAIFLTTALFNQIARTAPRILEGIRHVLFGGEAAEPRWVERVLHEGAPARLLHMYGPTEATTFATWHEVRHVPPAAVTIPIGRPLANTEVYVLDRHGEPVPAGVPGEIHIGGPGLAHGYLAGPAATAERFVAHPFGSTPGARLYRTGDRARYRDDGEIEFLGRLDRQVKVRGFRIEPTEVEAALVRTAGIREAAVITRGAAAETRQLVAYVVPEPGSRPSPDDLRAALRRNLPAFMVPAVFVTLPELPLSPNGKIDYRALPAPAEGRWPDTAPRLRPRDLTEHTLAAIWEDLLHVSPVGVRDSFFDLGGHSLLAVRMLEAVERTTGRRLSLATLFRDPTIERLAEALARAEDKPHAPLITLNAGAARPPLHFLHGDFRGGGLYSRALARALGPDQPLVVLHPHGLLDERVPESIEAMAAERVADLRAARPTGPYLLGGHCNGALVALEMARQLVREGDAVPMVALLDAGAPRGFERLLAASAPAIGARPGELLFRWRSRREAIAARMAYGRRRITEFRGADLQGRAASLGRAIGRSVASLGRTGKRRALPTRPTVATEALRLRYERVVGTYFPARYPGHLLVLRPEQSEDSRRDLGWSRVSPRVTVRQVPGNHSTCLTRHVAATAAALRAAMDDLF